MYIYCLFFFVSPEIELPSPQYYLEVVNPKITSFDPATSEAEALQLGSTAIILRDRSILS